MKKGFTLIELVIAVALSVMVMIAAVNVSTIMVRQQLQGVHRGEVNGMTLAALDSMSRDIEGASYLKVTTLGSPPVGNVVAGCTNWSSVGSIVAGAVTPATLDSTQNVNYFIYCIDAARFGTLWKWSGTFTAPVAASTCNPVPSACGVGGTYNAAGPTILVQGNGTTYGISYGDKFNGVAPNPTGPYFSKSRDTNGLDMHYIVGNSTPSSIPTFGHPEYEVPQYYKVDTRIDNVKSFNNTAD